MRSVQHVPLTHYRQPTLTIQTGWYVGLSLSIVVALWVLVSISGYIPPHTLPSPTDVLRVKRLDRGLGSHWHKNWRLNYSMRRSKRTSSGLAAGFFELKGKFLHIVGNSAGL
jgi:ABC-type nitrate/sulfonate/bicarbonate transport system permease component